MPKDAALIDFLFGGYCFNHNLIPFSALFNDTDFMERTPAIASNRKRFIFRCRVKKNKNGTEQHLLAAGDNNGNKTRIRFDADDSITIDYDSTTTNNRRTTQAKYRDLAGFYDIVWSCDTDDATEANRWQLYVNRNLVTDFSVSGTIAFGLETSINNNVLHRIGSDITAIANQKNDYSCDYMLLDGVSFQNGDYSIADFAGDYSKNENIANIFKPVIGGYGLNGWLLDFSDIANLGKDIAPIDVAHIAANNWSINGAMEQMLDTASNNLAVINGLSVSSISTRKLSLSGGNLTIKGNTNYGSCYSTLAVASGKFYWEVLLEVAGPDYVGIASSDADVSTSAGGSVDSYVYKQSSGEKVNGGVSVAYGEPYTSGDILGIALNMDDGEVTFYKNNTSQGTAFTGLAGKFMSCNSMFGSGAIHHMRFSEDSWAYSAPSGFKALTTANLPKADDLQPNLTGTTDILAVNDFWYLGGPLNTTLINSIGATTLIEGTHFENHSNGILMLTSFSSGQVYNFTLAGLVGAECQPPMQAQ